MADNIELSAGTGGAVIATDDITSIHYQINKLAFGALDSATLAAGGAGAVTAGTQRVTLASDDPAVASLAIIDNMVFGAGTEAAAQRVTIATDSTGVLSVDDNGGSLTIDNAQLSVVGGGTEAAAMRVTIASDSTGVLSVDDNGGSLTVDNAGLTELAAAINASSQVDVNIAASTATVAVSNAGLTELAGAINASAQVDVNIAASAASVAVTNAGLTELAAAINVSSQMDVNIAASGATVPVSNAGITTIAGAVSGTEMQVDVVAALPAGTNAIGKLAANSGVDIGDVDVTSISAGTNNIGNVGLIPRTSGGMTIFNSIDLDESEEEIKATAGQVFSIAAFNHTNAPLYLRFYNATAANTTVGTTAAHVGPFTVPGNNDTDGAGFIWNNEIGIAFGTAISAAVTTGIAANDTGAPAANACSVVVGYV